MKEIAQVVVKQFYFRTPVEHTRSIPCGGLCVMLASANRVEPWYLPLVLAGVTIMNAIQAVTRSVVQLFVGVYYVVIARRARLAYRYFTEGYIEGPPTSS